MLVQYFGLGEVTGNITVLPPDLHDPEDGPQARIGSCGYERTGMQVSIQGDDGEERKPFETGEICVIGPAGDGAAQGSGHPVGQSTDLVVIIEPNPRRGDDAQHVAPLPPQPACDFQLRSDAFGSSSLTVGDRVHPVRRLGGAYSVECGPQLRIIGTGAVRPEQRLPSSSCR